jgi:hypothetical protein
VKAFQIELFCDEDRLSSRSRWAMVNAQKWPRLPCQRAEMTYRTMTSG